MRCKVVGETNSDVAGLGVILGFAIQAFIFLVLSVISFLLRDALEPLSSPSQEHLSKLRRRIDAVLASAFDAQSIAGISLLLSALVQHSTLELYHYHIIYDTVNFVAVTFCAAIVCSFAHKEERKLSRYLAIAAFSALYLAFVIVFGLKLEQWNWDIAGRCYNPAQISAPTASHPYVDKIYLSITCLYMYSIMYSCLIHARQTQPDREGSTARDLTRLIVTGGLLHLRPVPHNIEINEFAGQRFMRFSIMVVALLQFPLHLYSIIALRSSNESLLNGESENSWGFGQIVALVMVVPVIIECCNQLHEYRELSKEGAEEISLASQGEGA